MQLFDHLRNMKLFRLRFICKAETLLELDHFWGSALHGIFGQVIKKHYSVTNANGLLQLTEKGEQLMRLIIAQTAEEEKMNKYADPPQPMIFIIGLNDRILHMPGDGFEINITLVGNAVEQFPEIIKVIKWIGIEGIGRLKGHFRLQEVLIAKDTTDTFLPFNEVEKPTPMIISGVSDSPTYTNGVSLSFVSPVHLKVKGRFAAQPAPELLLERIFDRLTLLNHFYCGSYLPEDKPDFSNYAISATYHLSTYPFARYSNRHQMRLELVGQLGKILLQGDIKEVLPLLYLGQWVNIGKMASMGLGHFTVHHE